MITKFRQLFTNGLRVPFSQFPKKRWINDPTVKRVRAQQNRNKSSRPGQNRPVNAAAALFEEGDDFVEEIPMDELGGSGAPAASDVFAAGPGPQTGYNPRPKPGATTQTQRMLAGGQARGGGRTGDRKPFVNPQRMDPKTGKPFVTPVIDNRPAGTVIKGKCWLCGATGHRVQDCPKSKNVNLANLEEMQHHGYAAYYGGQTDLTEAELREDMQFLVCCSVSIIDMGTAEESG